MTNTCCSSEGNGTATATRHGLFNGGWQTLICALAAFVLTSSAHGQLRIMNYNIAKLQGNITALEDVLAAAHIDDRPGFYTPVSVFIFQEVPSTVIADLADAVAASAPPGVSYIQGTYTTNGSEDNSGGAQAMFYRSGFLTENAAAHVDLSTGGGRNTDRWQLRLAGYNSPLAWFYVYGSHLKADTGAANQNERLAGVTTIRTNADALGANQHLIYSGDMNFYTNAEPGYVHFFSAGNGLANDALGTGSWAGSNSPPNNANNIKHTQSPLATGVGGLVGGGMNSRFDFQLCTSAFNDGAGLSRIAGTYRAFGNDGLHFGQAIDNNNNFYYVGNVPRSNALANALRLASDHIPLIVDYQIPARLSATMPANYGRVIVGTPFNLEATISNSAVVDDDIGADELLFSATGTVGLSGTVTNPPGGLFALAPGVIASFPLNTATAAIRNGTVTVTTTSQGAQPGSVVLNTTGTVVRPANPSFSSSSDVVELNLPLAYDANTGTQQFQVNVHNRGFDALQATLDIDLIDGFAAPFSYISGIASSIGSTPATLTFGFNTTGLSPGNYPAAITIHTSDEDIPGEDVAALQLLVNVTINGTTPTCPEDIAPPGGGDGLVGVPDLLALINAWGPCANPKDCPADLDNSGTVGVPDLLMIINGWGVCD